MVEGIKKKDVYVVLKEKEEEEEDVYVIKNINIYETNSSLQNGINEFKLLQKE